MSSDAPDTLTRFLLPAAGVRGVAVRLDATWDAVAGRADYPPAARELLGEAAAAAVLFTGHTKVDGRLSIQIRGERGLRTLFARVRWQSTAAMTLAERLTAHPRVAEVLYPGLPGFHGHGIASRQMTGGYGGMLSIRVKGGTQAAIDTAARVGIWRRATSLGGVESLIEHRASIEGPTSPVPGDLLRLSVGLESPDDLYDDLAEALGQG